MEAHKNDRTAFLIGEDYGRYGLSAPAEADEAFMQGYESVQSQRRRALTADRFVRKWLQVRFNAWKRNRYVAPEFSLEFLRSIDRPKCPVSEVEFTYGTGTDSDWSVDRIDNDGGYTPRNVVVVTTRVNRAKGSLSLRQILMLGHLVDRPEHHAKLPPPVPRGKLHDVEWRKLAWFASTQEKDVEYPVRDMFDPPDEFGYLMHPWCPRIQRAFVKLMTFPARQREHFWAGLRLRSSTPMVLALLDQLHIRLKRYAKDTPTEKRLTTEVFADEATWHLFADWWIGMAAIGELGNLLIVFQNRTDQSKVIRADRFREEKQAETKGFG